MAFFEKTITYIFVYRPSSMRKSIEGKASPPNKSIDTVIQTLTGSPPGKCSICFEDYCRPVRIKQCGHVFCDSCIRSTLASISHCPLDARELFPDKAQSVQAQLQLQLQQGEWVHPISVIPFSFLIPGLGTATVSLALLLVEALFKIQGNTICTAIALIVIAPMQRLLLARQMTMLLVSTNAMRLKLGQPVRLQGLFEIYWAIQFILTPWVFAAGAQMMLIVACWVPFLGAMKARFGVNPTHMISLAVPLELSLVILRKPIEFKIRAGEPQIVTPEL